MANRLNKCKIAASSHPKMAAEIAIESWMNLKWCFSGCQSHI